MICLNCKADNPQHANYCRMCGAKLNDMPEIMDFHYSATPHKGDTIELSWHINNADSVVLNDQNMPLSHQYKVIVDKEETWELVAKKGSSRISKKIHIVPVCCNERTFVSPSNQPIKPTVSLRNNLFVMCLLVLLPICVLLIINIGSSWVRYNLNLSYNDWNNVNLYTNVVSWGWLIFGICFSLYMFHHKNK